MTSLPLHVVGRHNDVWSRERLANLQEAFADAPPEKLLNWAFKSFAPQICLATSFGPQSIVLMHLVSRLRPETTLFYLDTELLFLETYTLRAQLERRLGLNIVRVTPQLSVADQARVHGPDLWARQPDQCCEVRKVLPLRRFLCDQRAWITGVRRSAGPSRASAQMVEWDHGNGLVKLNPLVDWSREQVWDYLREHDLPTNSLHERGYPSIGCRPCTRPVQDGEDERAGRWDGFEKTECGIHRWTAAAGDKPAVPEPVRKEKRVAQPARKGGRG
jgi:phosphoadenosine phosphosulfate reductase